MHDDTYAGYASCPDTLRAYVSYSKENQLRWMKKSEETILEFIVSVSTFNNFLSAYSFLANKRHEIATELKQRTDEGRMDYYGSFRKEGDHARRTISAGDGEQFWKWQKAKIFELTHQLIKSTQSVQVDKPGFLFENDSLTCIKEKISVDEHLANYYCINIKFPKSEMLVLAQHSKMLAQIELYDFQDHHNFNQIRIEYTPIDLNCEQGNFQLLDQYYQRLIHWERKQGIHEFLINAGKLFYFIAHFMPVKQGNAAIMEWMLRAIAFVKGIELGCFNYSEGISWDFKALLTADINDYTKWFTSKLFDSYTLSEVKPEKQFQFPKG